MSKENFPLLVIVKKWIEKWVPEIQIIKAMTK